MKESDEWLPSEYLTCATDSAMAVNWAFRCFVGGIVSITVTAFVFIVHVLGEASLAWRAVAGKVHERCW